MKADGLVWDACGLINLAATDVVAEILGSMNCPSYVVRHVIETEVIQLRSRPAEDQTNTLVPIDLSPAVQSGHISVVDLRADEIEKYVELAVSLDDGEAMSLAVAANRGLSLVTDDRVAIRIAASLPVLVPIVTTPEFMQTYFDNSAISPEAISHALLSIEQRAQFRLRASHPLYSWWTANI